MPASAERTASAADEGQRQGEVVVRVAVAHVAAVEDDRLIEDRTLAVRRGGQVANEPCEQPRVMTLDPDERLHLRRIVLVV